MNFEYQPKICFQYSFNGKNHKYFPDFIVDGKYIEIKGDHFFKEDGTMYNPFDHTQDGLYEAKHQCMVNNNVEIWNSKIYDKYLSYFMDNYSIDTFKFKKVEDNTICQ